MNPSPPTSLLHDCAKVHWRKEFQIHAIDPMKFLHHLENRIIYVNGADRNGRVIMYFKIGNIRSKIPFDIMISMLMYTVERADRRSVEIGSGEFIAIIDLHGMSFQYSPSFSVIKKALSLLKYNYPYRYHHNHILCFSV